MKNYFEVNCLDLSHRYIKDFYYEGSKGPVGRGYFYFSNSRFNHRGATERADAGLNLLLFDRLKVVDSDDIPLSTQNLKG